MKRRVFNVLNFFAFNLLFFALYLNFIYKDNSNLTNIPLPKSATAAKAHAAVTENDKAFSGTLQPETAVKTASIKEHQSGEALKISFN